MHRSSVALTLVASLLLGAACSGAAAPTPQIVYVTPAATIAASPTATSAPATLTPATPTPAPAVTGGVIGERSHALVATMEPLGYAFEPSSGPNGEPALTGTAADAMSAVMFVNDPITAVVFRGFSTGDFMKHFVDLFVQHDRLDVVAWAMEKINVLASTGRVVSDSTVLDDGNVATFASEMVGSDLMVTVTMQSE